jgi:hypothetical protein
VLVAASLCVGYWVGVKSRTSAGDSGSAPQKPSKAKSGREASSGNETSEGEGDLHSLQIDQTEECKMVKLIGNVFAPTLTLKQVLVVRTDLGMSSGKIAAQ